MNNKPLIVGLIVGVGLIGAFFALKKPTKDLKALSPKTIKPITDFSRIVIIPSKQSTGADGMGKYAGELSYKGSVPDKIVLEKIQGGWFLTHPFKAPTSDIYNQRLEEAFAQIRRSDDIAVPKTQLRHYALTPELRTEIKAFGKDTTKPALHLFVGKELVVPQTKARRTFVQWPGDDNIYRLQAPLGFVRHRSPDAMRSRTLVRIQPTDITTLTFSHRGKPPITIQQTNKKWSLVTPKIDMKLDQESIGFVLEALKKLTISDFENKLTIKTAGLDDPDMTLTINGTGTVKQPISLALKKVTRKPDFTSLYYIQLKGRQDVFSITALKGGHLTPTIDRLRNLYPRPIDEASVTGITFLNRDKQKKIILEKKGDNWTMVEPVQSDTVDTLQVESMLKYLTNMRVGRYITGAQNTGLDDKAEKVEIRTTKGPVHLLIGAKIPNEKDMYYGKFADVPTPFVLTKYMIRRFKPKLKDMLPPNKVKETK